MTSGAEHRRSKIAFKTGIALLLFALGVYAFQISLFRDTVNDDAFITFRYSRNLVDGHGPVYNRGERVEGYSNPLHMLLSAGVIRVGGAEAAPGIVKWIGIVLGGGSILATLLLGREVMADSSTPLHREIGAASAAMIAAVSPSFALNSTTGLETSEFTLLITLGLALMIRETRKDRQLHSWIPLSLAAISRPEGGALALILIASMFCVRVYDQAVRSRLLRNACIVILVIACHTAVRILYYDGEWLPNTFHAKAGGARGPITDYISQGIFAPCGGIPGFAGAVAGYVLSRAWRSAIPAAAAALFGIVFLACFGLDWMAGHRLIVPFLPAFAVVCCAGWIKLAGRITSIRPLVPALAVIILSVTAYPRLAHERSRLHRESLVNAAGFRSGHRALARWLEREASPGATVAIMDIGMVGYRCIDLNILDLTGLTDRAIGKSPGTFLAKKYDPTMVLGRDPDYVVFTLAAAGTPFSQPPVGTYFRHWTDMESRIAHHPDFTRRYVRTRDLDPRAEPDWRKLLASQIGAVRIFEHGHPRHYYLLAVFQRTDPEQ